jgi:hypothetical protein
MLISCFVRARFCVLLAGNMSRRLVLLVLMVVPLWFVAGCAAPRNFSAPSEAPRANSGKVWLLSNGFHSSIALRSKDCPAAIQAIDRRARYFVIGWGGRDFYMGLLYNPWDYVRTVLFPMPSTLHVLPVRTGLLPEFPRAEIIEFDVKPSGLEALRGRLSADFRHDAQDHLVVDGPGRLPLSRFYSGTETYFLPKTCNVWAASHLKLAGVPMSPGAAVSAGNVCWQGGRQGRVLSVWRFPRQVL